MYNGTARTYRQGKSSRHTGKGAGGNKMSRLERLRFCQLLICLALFLVVFLGKGIFPAKLVEIRDSVLSLITSDTDFRSAFSTLGGSLSENTIFGQMEDFCVEVFGVGKTPSVDNAGDNSPDPALTSMTSAQVSFLSGNPNEQEIADHLLYQSARKIPIPASVHFGVQQSEEEAAVPTQEVKAVPAAGTLILKSDYSGEELPNNYTMDQLSLGDLETVTPVLGYINSGYGYRDHPISGVYQFHGGVDISGKTGDPIQAFAAGTVEYVGEDDSFGLYLQLDHGNGVKSFYAHCSAVCVKKGQTVALGEKIAEVGASGTATGPHLHLELKYNKMHLNPIYYITYLSR